MCNTDKDCLTRADGECISTKDCMHSSGIPHNIVDPQIPRYTPAYYMTKDSGIREEFKGGMVRDTQKGKPRYDLCWKPLYRRWAELMARGAEKYGENNWRNACDETALRRFHASAERHLQQWLEGESTEDHAAAVIFNLAGAEYVRGVIDAVYENRD